MTKVSELLSALGKYDPDDVVGVFVDGEGPRPGEVTVFKDVSDSVVYVASVEEIE